jgi:hypothetical protein
MTERPRLAIVYRGRNAAGTGVTGRAQIDDLAAWTEERFQGGWQELVARPIGGRDPIAGITNITGSRTWWADTEARDCPTVQKGRGHA